MGWKTIKVFSSRIEAEIIKGLLESHDIQSLIQADDMGGMRPELAFSRGVHLQVNEDDFTKAKMLIEDTIS